MNNFSKAGRLLSQYPKLKELCPPFDEYYAYYRLRESLETEMEKFLSEEEAYINSMELTILKEDSAKNIEYQSFSAPYKLSDFLPRHDEKKGNSSELSAQLFNNILRAPGSNWGDKKTIKSFSFKKTDEIKKSGIGDSVKTLVGASMISAFSRKAEMCREQGNENRHSKLVFLDFISAFCGFKNFENFLNSKFGPNYKKEEDMTLQGLLQKYPFEKEQAPVRKQNPEFETTTELVSKSIHKPKFLIGRDEDLEKILEILESKRKVAVIGEGGMGKTSVAAALYHRALERKNYSDVAWLFCEHGTISALFETAQGLGINLEVLKPEDKLPSITHALKEKGENLLLVLDNVENDLDDFFQAFQGFNGHVLITSRSSFGWEGLEEHRLPALSSEDAKALFKIHYSEKNGVLESGPKFEKLLDRLISAIGYNTLLIELFAKLLKQDFSDTSGSEYGIRQFLDKLEKEGLFLGPGGGEVKTNYSFHRRKKVATIPEILEILYDFSKLGEPARQILANLSLLPAQEFSDKELLELFVPTETREFRRTLSKLYSQGWIGGDGRKVVKVSPVVQEMSIRKNKETLWDDGKGLVQRITDLIEYEPEKDNSHTKFKWIPLAARIIQSFQDSAEIGYIRLLNALGILLIELGGLANLLDARKLLEKALDSIRKNFGDKAPAVSTSRSHLALVFRALGGRKNLEQAKTQLELALVSDLKNFGDNAPEVATCRSNLTLVLLDLGGKENLERAKSELELALESDRNNFGDQAPAVAIRSSNLAMVLRALGGSENLRLAETELRLALDSNLKNFGDTAPAVATSRSNLATVLQDLGGRENFGMARTEFKLALESKLKNFGDTAPVVATSRSNLALVLQDLGGRENLELAKTQLDLALESYRKNFGDNAPDVAICRSNLATVLKDLGGRENLKQAKTLLTLALDSNLKNFDDHAPTVATSRSNMAMVLRALGGIENLQLAKTELRLALESNLKNFGDTAPVVATSRSNLALVLNDLGGRENLQLAKTELRLALESNLKNFDDHAPAVATSRSNLALVLNDLGGRENLEQAKTLLTLALGSSLNNFGDNAPTVAICRSNLALALKDLGGRENLLKAENELRLALESDRNNFGKDSPLIIIPTLSLAAVLIDLNGKENLLESSALLTEIQPQAILHFGKEHPITISVERHLNKVIEDLRNL